MQDEWKRTNSGDCALLQTGGMRIELPDSDGFTPTHQQAVRLFARIDKPMLWIARHSGISYNRVRMLRDGYRLQGDGDKAEKVPVLIKYPEVVTLELIADILDLTRVAGRK